MSSKRITDPLPMSLSHCCCYLFCSAAVSTIACYCCYLLLLSLLLFLATAVTRYTAATSYVSNVFIIFDGFMLLCCQLWMFCLPFISFFGTNLLTQCQVRVPVFSVFLTLFRSDFGTESKRNKIPRINVSRTEEDRGTWGPRQEAHKPWRRGQGGPAVTRPVASLELPCPSSLAYIFPKILEKIKASTKPLFHRRNLLYPWDPIWGPFPAIYRRGIRSRRASTSTP